MATCYFHLLFCFVFVVIYIYLNVKTSYLENKLAYADPCTGGKEMLASPLMMGRAEVVFGKAGIAIQLPGLHDPELAIILPFLENIKSVNKIGTWYLNKRTFPGKWKYACISMTCPSLGLGGGGNPTKNPPNFQTEIQR